MRTISSAHFLKKIDYPGTNNYSQLAYDGLWRNTKIVETTSGSVTSTKQFVWFPRQLKPSEERDAGSSTTRKLFQFGQTISGSSYFYSYDFPGSVRELTDSSGAIQAQYFYDAYGRSSKLIGSLDADFQYAAYYLHQRSALNFTLFRSYSPGSARWLSRDPLGERAGLNLHTYVNNTPVSAIDPSGLMISCPHEDLDPCEQCHEDWLNCKADCIRRYPKGPKRDDCISDCKAELLRCQAENCK